MKALVDLVNALVRPLCTFALVAAFVWESVVGKVPTEAFLSVVSMVLGFWYMQRQNGPPPPPAPGGTK